MSSATAQVLPIVLPAEIRQAEYFEALLRELWAGVEEQIAEHHAALDAVHDGGDEQHARRVLRQIAAKRRDQFELERLRQQLERRFFGGAATAVCAAAHRRCFDASVERRGSWWTVAIPELGQNVSARRREDVETVARAHISAVLGAPMSEVAVRFLDENRPDVV